RERHRGDSLHDDLAVLESDVVRVDAVQLGRGQLHLVVQLAAGHVDGVAGGDHGPAGDGADSVLEILGVAPNELDFGHGYGQRVGGHLDEGGGVALPLRGGAGGDAHRAGGQYRRPCRLEGAEPGHFDVHAEPRAAVNALLAQPVVLGAQPGQVDHLLDHVEHLDVVTGVQFLREAATVEQAGEVRH